MQWTSVLRMPVSAGSSGSAQLRGVANAVGGLSTSTEGFMRHCLRR